MKKKILSLISLLFATSAFAQSPQEIVNNYLDATGGKEKYNFETYQYKRSYTANAATDFSELVTVGGSEKFSKVKSIMDRDFYYVLNESAGWIKIPMGSRDKAPNYSVKDLNTKEKDDLKQEGIDGLWPFLISRRKDTRSQETLAPVRLMVQLARVLFWKRVQKSGSIILTNPPVCSKEKF